LGSANSGGTLVTFKVDPIVAGSLAPGTYGPTTITFTSSTGLGTQTRTATLTVNPPALQVTPATDIAASGTQGGPFSPSAFSYILSVASGSVNYSISNVPPWLTLTPSSTGTVSSSSPTTVTFMVNENANSLTPNTYVNSINFNNTTNGQGSTTRVAKLTVNPLVSAVLQWRPLPISSSQEIKARSLPLHSHTHSVRPPAPSIIQFRTFRVGSPHLQSRAMCPRPVLS
jgi:hypothetical protein